MRTLTIFCILAVLCLGTTAYAGADTLDPETERLMLQCGNAAGSLDSPLAQFCIRFMSSTQGLDDAPLTADSCGACISRCSEKTSWYADCTATCASSCGLEKFIPVAELMQSRPGACYR